MTIAGIAIEWVAVAVIVLLWLLALWALGR